MSIFMKENNTKLQKSKLIFLEKIDGNKYKWQK